MNGTPKRPLAGGKARRQCIWRDDIMTDLKQQGYPHNRAYQLLRLSR